MVRPGPEAHAPLAIHRSPHLGDFPRPRRLFRGNAIKYNSGILGAILDTDIHSTEVMATDRALRRQHLQLLRGLHPPRHCNEWIRGGRHHR